MAKGARAHEMEEIFALAFEAGGAVRHDAFALCGSDFAAEVRLAGFAEFAFAAFGGAMVGGRLELLLNPFFFFPFVRGCTEEIEERAYYSATTLSPGLTDVTLSPTDSTIPAPS